MNRIQQVFAQKKQQVLNVYCTAGYPERDSLPEVIKALQEHGADLIEVGMPYSDPVADGPVIQQSNSAALQNGMNIKLLFEQLKSIKEYVIIPVILMGYLNPVLQFGIENFFVEAAKAGVDGIILPELPMMEYHREYKYLMKKNNIEFIFLITPETSQERIRQIDTLSNGFIYAVSSSSVTGNNKSISGQAAYFKRLQQMQLKNPILVGFGIKDKKTFTTACTYTSGAIIGTAYIKALENTTDINKNTKEFLNAITG